MVINQNRITTGTMNVNACQEKISKPQIIYQIQPIRGIINMSYSNFQSRLVQESLCIAICTLLMSRSAQRCPI
ncbi:hypothetical protein WP5S18E01_07610 [Enterobacter cloacae]|nr:hypothetical protein WP5S18E01_07610 [Enterobacter cloacae]